MRRQRHFSRPTAPSQNLDSFLDIMTNTVGVLMFVSLFVTLVAVQSSTIIRTPLLSQTRKSPHFFEVANGTVSHLDTDEVERQFTGLVQQLPRCQEPREPFSYDFYNLSQFVEELRRYEACLEQRNSVVRNFSPSIDGYLVEVVGVESLAMKYTRLTPTAGVTREDLGQRDSQFQQVLAGLDPEHNFVAFIVRPDSFATFRRAREIAWQQGFNVGWEPYKQDSSLVFGQSGRSIGIQ